MTKEESLASWPNSYWDPGNVPVRGHSVDEIISRCIEPYKASLAVEIGPGGGYWTRILAQRFGSVIACDVVPESAMFKKEGTAANVAYHEIVGEKLPIENQTVDFIWSYDVFCHLSQSETTAYLREFKRCLKPNATAVIMFPHWERFVKSCDPVPRPLGQMNSLAWYHYDLPIIQSLADEAGLVLANDDMLPGNRDRIVSFCYHTGD